MPNEQSPEPKSRASSTPPSADTENNGYRRQALSWRRRLRLSCGCSQFCRCEYKRNPSDKRVTAYREAVEHLAKHGLAAAALTAECRELWRRGGSDRQMADMITRRWNA